LRLAIVPSASAFGEVQASRISCNERANSSDHRFRFEVFPFLVRANCLGWIRGRSQRRRQARESKKWPFLTGLPPIQIEPTKFGLSISSSTTFRKKLARPLELTPSAVVFGLAIRSKMSSPSVTQIATVLRCFSCELGARRILSKGRPSLIEGIVTDDGVPVIEMQIDDRRWQAIIDTGFNGELELP
jgi:hypothetical protein